MKSENNIILNEVDIAKYVESFLGRIIKEPILIEYDKSNESYKLNYVYFKRYDFWNKPKTEIIEAFENYSFKGDYIGTIFFFLSGYWEYVNQIDLDEFHRFPSHKSFQKIHDILYKPVVDVLVSRIRDKIGVSYKDFYNSPKIFVTHDIDQLGLVYGTRFFKGILKDILVRKDINAAFEKIKFKVINKDPHSVENLIEIHKKHHSKGTFFFLPSVQPRNTYGGYSLKRNKNKIVRLLNKIKENKHSAGLHYDSRYLTSNRMLKDVTSIKKLTNKEFVPGRAHFLIFNIIESFNIYENAGIRLDSSGGYADSIGFRFGTTYPFKPYNFEEKREYNFLEVPLIVMDATLKSENYMNLSPQEGLDIIKKMIDKTSRYNGIFTVLWHNTSFYSNGWNDWKFVYEETIKYGKKRGFVSVNAEDIMNLYEVNNE